MKSNKMAIIIVASNAHEFEISKVQRYMHIECIYLYRSHLLDLIKAFLQARSGLVLVDESHSARRCRDKGPCLSQGRLPLRSPLKESKMEVKQKGLDIANKHLKDYIQIVFYHLYINYHIMLYYIVFYVQIAYICLNLSKRVAIIY